MKNAIQIIKTLQDNGHQALFCGGMVRDKLLGIEPNDIDISTSATPEQICSLFEKTLLVGASFGVIVVIINGEQYEVCTFRSDSEGSDGRRPDSVTFSNMYEDAQRRDLTINGMYYDPISDKLYDFVGGKKDLQDGIIRLIGDANNRITEDKLRIMRVIRFAARFEFEIERETFVTVCKRSKEILNVSQERIAQELLGMLVNRSETQRMFALKALEYTGLMEQILPEVYALKDIQQSPEHHPEVYVGLHSYLACSKLPIDSSEELLIATLIHDIGKAVTMTVEGSKIQFINHEDIGSEMAQKICERMKFSNEFTFRIVGMVKNHMRLTYAREMRKSKLKRMLALPYFSDLLELHKADCLGSDNNLSDYNFCLEKLNSYEPEVLRPVRKVTGNDLIELGFVQGKIFKEILTFVEDLQLEQEDITKEQLIEEIKSKFINN